MAPLGHWLFASRYFVLIRASKASAIRATTGRPTPLGHGLRLRRPRLLERLRQLLEVARQLLQPRREFSLPRCPRRGEHVVRLVRALLRVPLTDEEAPRLADRPQRIEHLEERL